MARNKLEGVGDENGATSCVLLHFSNATRQLESGMMETKSGPHAPQISTDAIAVPRRPASGQQVAIPIGVYLQKKRQRQCSMWANSTADWRFTRWAASVIHTTTSGQES